MKKILVVAVLFPLALAISVAWLKVFMSAMLFMVIVHRDSFNNRQFLVWGIASLIQAFAVYALPSLVLQLVFVSLVTVITSILDALWAFGGVEELT